MLRYSSVLLFLSLVNYLVEYSSPMFYNIKATLLRFKTKAITTKHFNYFWIFSSCPVCGYLESGSGWFNSFYFFMLLKLELGIPFIRWSHEICPHPQSPIVCHHSSSCWGGGDRTPKHCDSVLRWNKRYKRT